MARTGIQLVATYPLEDDRVQAEARYEQASYGSACHDVAQRPALPHQRSGACNLLLRLPLIPKPPRLVGPIDPRCVAHPGIRHRQQTGDAQDDTGRPTHEPDLVKSHVRPGASAAPTRPGE